MTDTPYFAAMKKAAGKGWAIPVRCDASPEEWMDYWREMELYETVAAHQQTPAMKHPLPPGAMNRARLDAAIDILKRIAPGADTGRLREIIEELERMLGEAR